MLDILLLFLESISIVEVTTFGISYKRSIKRIYQIHYKKTTMQKDCCLTQLTV